MSKQGYSELIHEAFIKAEVAKRYYRLKGKELPNEQARKNFFIDKSVDKTLLKQVINEIYKEQKRLLL